MISEDKSLPLILNYLINENCLIKILRISKIKKQILKEKIMKLMGQLQDFSHKEAITTKKLTIWKEESMIWEIKSKDKKIESNQA